MLKQGKGKDIFISTGIIIVTNYSSQKFHNTVGKEITFVKMTKVLKPMKNTANRLISKMLLYLKN